MARRGERRSRRSEMTMDKAPAWAAYQEAKAQAWKAYEEALAPARKAYQ